MKLLIIGATSYIGSRLVFDLQDKYEIVGTYHNNNSVSSKFIHVDIRDLASIDRLVAESNPDVIIHLANYSSSRQIKDNEIDFPKLNLEATKNIVDTANKYEKPIIFFSSMAATTKQDLYGELKAESEAIIKTAKHGFNIVRPSAVIGLSPVQSHNKITDKILSVKNGLIQEFDNSWILQPTYIGHLSQVIEQIISKDIWNEELNIFIDYPVTQFQIANDILKQFGMKAKPLDTGRVVPLAKIDDHKMKLFTLFPTSYQEVIDRIVNEIKNPLLFQIKQ